MSAIYKQPDLRLVHDARESVRIAALANTEAEQDLLAACQQLISKATQIPEIEQTDEAGLEAAASALVFGQSDHDSFNLSDEEEHRSLIKVWPILSVAPFFARKGEGTDLVIVSADFGFHLLNSNLRSLFSILQRFSMLGRTRIAILESPKRSGMLGAEHAKRLEARLNQDLPAYDVEILPLDLGVATLSASPTSFDIILVDQEFGSLVANVASESIDEAGVRPVMYATDRQSCCTIEAVPRIGAKNTASPHDAMPHIMTAVLMLAMLGQASAAVQIRDALLTTIEDRIFPLNTRVDFFGQSRLKPLAFASAIGHRLGRKPRQLPAAKLSITAQHRNGSSGNGDGHPHLSIVS